MRHAGFPYILALVETGVRHTQKGIHPTLSHFLATPCSEGAESISGLGLPQFRPSQQVGSQAESLKT